MVYEDLYIINLMINETRLEIEPQSYSFSTTENINSLYSTASITFEDNTGLLQEYLGTVPGVPIEIEFGNKDHLNKTKFKINFDALDEPSSPGFITGKVDFFLIHESFFQQQIVSKAYKNRISKIVEKIMGNYNFSKIDIDDTGNEDTWYQPLITDAKFIQERLLPHAYSYNASLSPFYSYITSDNEYHFRNMKSMLDEGKLITIEYKNISGDSEEEKDRSAENKTSSMKRWRTQYKNIWKIQDRSLFSIDRETGDLTEDEDSITQYPAQNNLKLPVMSKKAGFNSWHDDYMSESETGKVENQLGLRISSNKPGMLIDEFLLIQPFNPILHAGKAIQLNVYTMNNEGSQISNNFSGPYIIVECEHVWDGESSRAYTKLIIGRKYISVANSYLVKEQLI